MFPTNADIAFWTQRRAPRWALALREEAEQKQRRLSWYRPDASIYACVNAHAGLKHVSYEASAATLCSFVRGWRKRGEDVRAELARIAADPGTVVNPEQRTRFARRWMKRIDAIRAEREYWSLAHKWRVGALKNPSDIARLRKLSGPDSLLGLVLSDD